MSPSLPARGEQIQSTLSDDGKLTIELVEVPVPAPGPDEVVVKIEAAPINPSDLLTLLASADATQARFEGTRSKPKVTIQLSAQAAAARSGRFSKPLVVGLEGAGEVVVAGDSARKLLGRKVAFLTLARGTLAQYLTLPVSACVPIPPSLTVRDCAALFVNPLTALAIAETVRLEGQSALVQTAAASNLGQMLLRICQEDGFQIVNIVRRPQQVDMLRSLGARYVCDSSAPGFHADLVAALEHTGARMAFDAIGGGPIANQILLAMEAAAAARLPQYSPYGSLEPKQIYIYGHLDPAPMQVLHEGYGLLWKIEGWVMPAILERAGAERAAALRQRALVGAKTTFASQFAREVSLAEALRPDAILAYSKQATGQKYLVCPHG